MQLDRARQARPHLIRAAVSTVAMGMACAFTSGYGQLRWMPGYPSRNIEPDAATDVEKLIAVGGALLILITGVVAVRAVAAAIRAAADDPGEARRTGPLALIVSAVGYLTLLLILLGALHIPVARVLLGGALTGIILGIAAQQSLGNFFAGIVLLAVRPFAVGERVTLKSGPLGGEYNGTVTEMSMFYVHLMTERGPALLPNAGVLGAAIGPGVRSVEEESEPEESVDPGIAQGGTASGS